MISSLHKPVGAGTWACLVFVLLMFVGCGGKPGLTVEDVRGITFHASGRRWDASAAEIVTLVAAYQRAEVRHDDIGTTPPVGVDVVLRSGDIMRIWGGSEGIQGVVYQGRDVDLRGAELGDLLGKIALQAEHDARANDSQPIRLEVNRTSSAAGARR